MLIITKDTSESDYGETVIMSTESQTVIITLKKKLIITSLQADNLFAHVVC